MSISKSLFSLITSNGGFFKSNKQAAFLLSQCIDGVYYSDGGSVYGNGYRFAFTLDAEGIVSVEKLLKTDTVTHWKRTKGSQQRADAYQAVVAEITEKKALEDELKALSVSFVAYQESVKDKALAAAMAAVKGDSTLLEAFNKETNMQAKLAEHTAREGQRVTLALELSVLLEQADKLKRLI